MNTLSKFLVSMILFIVATFWTTTGSAQTDKDKQLHAQANLDYLKSMSSKTTLNAAEMKKVRETMLALNNEARLNPNYRKAQGCKTALQVPANLTPLVIHEDLNKLAQEQADYQASIKSVTHDNRNYRDFGARVDKYLKNHPKPEACAGGMGLWEYPIGWMKSETHYRPTWNLDSYNGKSIPVNAVGYGVAKNGDMWYFTAIWSFVENPTDAPKTDADPVANKANPVATLKYTTSMKPGDKLMEGEKMVSANRNFQLRGTPAGDFVVEDVRNNRVIYTFPLSRPISPPQVSFLSYNPDGNICIDSRQSKAYCATNGRDGVAPFILNKSDRAELTNDGRLVLLDKQGNTIWDNVNGTVTPAAATPAQVRSGNNAGGSNTGNLALGKSARQSSDIDAIGVAGKAVDGNTDGVLKFDNSNSVSHTNPGIGYHWWEVDLGAVQDINRIVIWNREGDGAELLRNFVVTVSRSPIIWRGAVGGGEFTPMSSDFNEKPSNTNSGPLNPVWTTTSSSYTMSNLNKKGRYVRISLLDFTSTATSLTLAEVQVFGK